MLEHPLCTAESIEVGVKGEENDDADVEEEDVDVEEEDIEEEDRGAQNADIHFVRACAVEMHFNMSQEPHHTEIYR